MILFTKFERKFLEFPPEVHEFIIEKLDNKSKRALRATCVKMLDLLNQIPCMSYAIPYTCRLEEVELADGQKRYDMIHYAYQNRMDPIVPLQSFATVGEMIDCLQKVFKKIDTLKKLVLKVRGFSEPIQLVKNGRKLKVVRLDFDMNSSPIVVDGFVNQFDARVVEYLWLVGTNLGERVFGAFKVRQIDVFGRVNDAQLSSIRARDISLYNGTDLTVAGLQVFFKKMLKEEEPRDFALVRGTVEQMNFFGVGERIRRKWFPIKSTHCDTTLVLSIIHERPTPLPLNIFAQLYPKPVELRIRPTEPSPAVQNFIQSIAGDL